MDNTRKIERFAQEHNSNILAKLPYDNSFVDALVNLSPIVLSNNKFSGLFGKIAEQVINNIE